MNQRQLSRSECKARVHRFDLCTVASLSSGFSGFDFAWSGVGLINRTTHYVVHQSSGLLIPFVTIWLLVAVALERPRTFRNWGLDARRHSAVSLQLGGCSVWRKRPGSGPNKAPGAAQRLPEWSGDLFISSISGRHGAGSAELLCGWRIGSQAYIRKLSHRSDVLAEVALI